MTTKTKKQKAKVEPKVQVTNTVAETQPKVSTSEQKKSYKLPTFGRRKIEKPALFKLKASAGTNPVTYMIKAEDVVYDPETNTERAIRYIPGESSIFKDEQGKDAKIKEPIMFNNGILVVGKHNPTLKRFLDMHNGNATNPNRNGMRREVYYLVDTEVNAKKNVEDSKREVDALQLALTMPIEKLVGYAKVLGVNVDNSVDEIRWDMKTLAQKDPGSFIDGLKDPRTEMRELLLKAKEYNIIKMSKNKISWIIGDDLQMITHVPIGITALDKMVDFCLSKEGKPVFEEIKSKLSRFA